MLSPRGRLEAKFYGPIDLVFGLIFVGLGLILGLMTCGLVLVTSIIRKSM